jgi:hypothetical protein
MRRIICTYTLSIRVNSESKEEGEMWRIVNGGVKFEFLIWLFIRYIIVHKSTGKRRMEV